MIDPVFAHLTIVTNICGLREGGTCPIEEDLVPRVFKGRMGHVPRSYGASHASRSRRDQINLRGHVQVDEQWYYQ